MESSVSARSARCDANSLTVDLSDGRTLNVPLSQFPRLLHATAAQRQAWRITSRGLHWDELDEDISIAGLLAGHGDGTHRLRNVA